ncbi:hypothetical protein KIPB_015501, partial [Kipferlia bialata]|eukprot:g15501.t1
MQAPDVLTHVQKLHSYNAVAQPYQARLASVQQFLKAHSIKKACVASVDCTALQESLTSLLAQLVEAATLLAEEEKTLDPAESVSYVGSVAALLSEISTLSPVPLPQDPSTLSRSDK